MNLAPDRSELPWPPEKTLFPVRQVTLAVEPGDHPFHVAEREAAARNWREEIARNPALFDGKMVFQRRLDFKDGAIRGTGHIIPYSTFLWWRSQPAPTNGFHLFGFPVIVSSDGAIIAVRMSEHTANPGQVYCAAGSLDEGDVVEGRCDLLGNMLREVREETGLELSADDTDGRLFASHQRRRVTVYQFFRRREPARELVTQIEEHMRGEERPEIAGAVAIRSSDPTAHVYAAAMLPLIDWFFAGDR
ncbi:NUDIX hydrolase [Ciceribacter azotifigens]|uniref:NUDIX hydrolase n=1 Tax=Ciceribacter azotifigens TaxID=2069303 RepID=UPI003A8B7155